MEFFYHILYACLSLRFLAGNLSNLTVASSQYDISLCSETLVSDMLHVSELLVPRFGQLGVYLALPGWAALLGGPLFCSLFLFFYVFSQIKNLLLSFLLVAFAVDYLWRFVFFMPIWTRGL